MNSDNKTINTIFLGFLVVSFAGVANLATGIFPLTQSANAIDVDLADFKCFGMFNSCDNNIDNSVTDNSDNSQDNDVNITDSFNPVQVCGNNVQSTIVNNTSTSTCEIGVPDFAPSTIGLS
ncbi:MAG TPA: hypothetical protein VD815_00100 [Candidatus Saccharimonadales bacterium]|nr:hypothetical protein [Candidatus Saccharimonadales bacterium]